MNSLQKTLSHYQKKIRDFPPLENEEKDVSYDVESLFTNIPLGGNTEIFWEGR